jgi:hypothetical protein
VRTIPLDRILLETEYASPMTTNVARRFPFNSLLLALLIVFDVAAQLPLL